jgi:PPM family protein phosphatase
VSLTLRYAVRSDRGLVRNNNEDSVYAGPRLLAIADGMGGHAAGEVASKIVIGTLEPFDEDRPVPDLIETLRDSVSDANAALAESIENDSELQGMGTTLTAIRFAGRRIALVHVGDSRAYLMRGGQLTQITHDDTYVQSLVDSGKLTAEEASHHPRKSVILRALTGAEVEPDISIREAREGDRYLLCSDGLSDVVSATTLLETLAEGTPQSCADRLVDLALRGGGPDNITCIVADVVSDSDADDRPVVGGAVVDPDAEPPVEADHPAARAAAMARPDRPSEPAARRRHWRRTALAAAVAVVIVIAAVGGYVWTQSQYFVGQNGENVALFRGVNAQLGPISFYSVVQNTDLGVSTLTPAARNQVENGITAHNRSDGQQILLRLNDELQPPCPTFTPSPSTSSPSTSRAPSVSHAPSGHRSSAPVRRPTASAHVSSTPRSARTPTAERTSLPSQNPSPSQTPSLASSRSRSSGSSLTNGVSPLPSASPTESC